MTRLSLLALLACGAGLAPALGPPPAPRRDRYGDPLPPGAIARLGALHLRTGAQPQLTDVSHDRRWLATGDETSVRVWAVRTGRVAWRFDAPEDERVTSFRFTPDARSMLVVTRAALGLKEEDKSARVGLYEVPSGKRRYERKVEALRGSVWVVGGGKWLQFTEWPDPPRAVTDTVLWSVDTGKEHRRFWNTTAAACSDDGKLMVTAHEGGTVRLWNVGTAKEVW